MAEYTTWISINGDGSTANLGIESENVPVIAGQVYTFTVTASYSATWSNGYGILISWRTGTGTEISSTTASSGACEAGQYVTTTVNGTAPSGTVEAILYITQTGVPPATDELDVYYAALTDANGNPLNLNYGLNYTMYPWVGTANEAASSAPSLSWRSAPVKPGDYDSLVLSNEVELMGGPGGSPWNLPELLDSNGVGPSVRILAPPTMNSTGYGYEVSYDLGAPQPTQDVVASMLLDGERPFGYRASNRTIILPLIIVGTAAGGMGQVLKAHEMLMALIDQQTWEMKWTPSDTGLPLIIDCFRALPTTNIHGFNYNQGNTNTPERGRINTNIGACTLTIQALPYGRSDIDGVQDIAFSNPIINGQTTSTTPYLDQMNKIQSGNPGWSFDSKYDNAVHYVPPTPYPWPAATYEGDVVDSSGNPTTVSIVNCPSLHFSIGLGYDTQWPKAPTWKCSITFKWTLTDANGYSISFSSTSRNLGYGPDLNNPKWHTLTTNIPVNREFDFNKVAKYKVSMTNWSGSGTTGFVRTHLWLGFIQTMPWSITNPASPRGNVYNLLGLPGTARAPINVVTQLPAQAPATKEFTSGSGTWTVPDYVYNIALAEAFGGGGAGSSVSSGTATNLGGAGGGGGAYAAEQGLVVTPGTQIPYSCGAGGTAVQLNPTVVTFTHTGLNHWTCPSGVTQLQIELWGGGGAGAAGGGGGGGGEYARLSNYTVTPGQTYSMWVGNGGKANTGNPAGPISRAGQGSWFGLEGTKVGEQAVCQVHGGYSPLTGSTTGGQGGYAGGQDGDVTVHWWGGNGGNSPGQAGGGGGAAGGPSGYGANGGNSPATGGYKTGGKGATGVNGAGSGGNGANSPGVPVKGVAPGGGGGGGYTNRANYIGADGASGMVKLTYSVGNGNPVNGSASTVGSTSTTFLNGTGVQVKANGAASLAANVFTGGVGASAGSNTTAFAGGNGSWNTARQANNYLISSNNHPFTNLGSGTYNATSGVTSASAVAMSFGTMVALVMQPALDSSITVSDSAGNSYSLAQTSTTPAGAVIQAYVSEIKYAINTSTTLTVTGTTSQNTGVMWIGSQYIIGGLVTGNVGASNGTGTTSTATCGTGDNSTIQYELMVHFNNSGATYSNITPNFFSAVANNNLTNGTEVMQLTISENKGGNPDSQSYTLSSSVPWATLALPFAAANQAATAVNLGSVTVSAATSGQITSTGMGVNTGLTSSGAGGVFVVACETQGGAHISAVSDSGGNTWASVGSIGALSVYSASVSSAFPTGGTVNVTLSASDTGVANLWYIPGSYSVSNFGTASGSSTAPTVNVTPSIENSFVLGFIGTTTSVSVTTAPAAPWALPLYPRTGGTATMNTYMMQGSGDNTVTLSATLSASASWSAMALTLAVPVAGGGGGASGGPQGQGYDARYWLGGEAYSGGGKGGNGSTNVDSPGNNAAIPGGGGGGGLAQQQNQMGGAGGNGLCRITWQPPLTPFNTLVVHRPAEGASPALSPLQPIPITDTPSNIEYPVQSLIATQPANFNGTYSVILVANSWNSSTVGGVRNISVTINQYEYQGGPAYTVQCTRSLEPNTDIVNGIVSMGEVTLPIKDIPPSNDSAYFTYSVHDTDSGDRFQDILFLDTMGTTVLVNIPPNSPAGGQYVNYFIDEPTSDRDLGIVAGTYQNRKSSVSVLDYSLVSGGPLYVTPGDNLLMTYSTSGAPNLSVTYAPRWYFSRTV